MPAYVFVHVFCKYIQYIHIIYIVCVYSLFLCICAAPLPEPMLSGMFLMCIYIYAQAYKYVYV